MSYDPYQNQRPTPPRQFWSDQTQAHPYYQPHPPFLPPPQPPYKPRTFKERQKHYQQKIGRLPKWQQAGIGCGSIILILFLCGICAAIGNASSVAQQPLTQASPSAAPTQNALPANRPTPTPTEVKLRPSPTPTPHPTVAVPPTQPPPPAPTPTPVHTGLDGNPYGYDLRPGNLIYNPPSDLCNYIPCIASFWNGRGYVEECQDGEFSKSGGISGSCSRHGGDKQPLYSH